MKHKIAPNKKKKQKLSKKKKKIPQTSWIKSMDAKPIFHKVEEKDKEMNQK